MTNGHISAMDDDRLAPSSRFDRSESELSDINDLPMTSNVEMNGVEHSDDDAIHAMATSELDEDEDAPGEDDVDMDDDMTPRDSADRLSQDRASQGSSRSGKRKAEMLEEVLDDDQYIQQNPELYGLRRSVRAAAFEISRPQLTRSLQGRARPSRRVVRVTPSKLEWPFTYLYYRLRAPMTTKTKTMSTMVGDERSRSSQALVQVCTSVTHVDHTLPLLMHY